MLAYNYQWNSKEWYCYVAVPSDWTMIAYSTPWRNAQYWTVWSQSLMIGLYSPTRCSQKEISYHILSQSLLFGLCSPKVAVITQSIAVASRSPYFWNTHLQPGNNDKFFKFGLQSFLFWIITNANGDYGYSSAKSQSLVLRSINWTLLSYENKYYKKYTK
jgi:hypothetical protein